MQDTAYQNQSSIVEVMIKNFGVFFMPHSVERNSERTIKISSYLPKLFHKKTVWILLLSLQRTD